MSNIELGSAVRVVDHYYDYDVRGRHGVVVRHKARQDHEFLVLVDFGPDFKDGHRGNGLAASDYHMDTCWWVSRDDLLKAETPQTTPRQPTAPMTVAVLDLLKAKGSLTSMEAQGVLRCRQLPARILELKRLGWPIKTEMKRDATDQRYARYRLTAA